MRVDLPSSTEPAVAMRTSSAGATAGAGAGDPFAQWSAATLEVPLLLAILHRRLADPVVGPGLAALGDARGRDLRDHRLERGGPRLDGAGTGHVAHRPVADRGLEGLLARQPLDIGVLGVEHPVAAEDAAGVGEVDRREVQAPPAGVMPHGALRAGWDRGDAPRLAPPG